MKEFCPTYLYIKQHNITGLKYFGKTINSNPIKYKGSGKWWTRHLQKYGNNVSTIWFQLFENQSELVTFATNFSKENNIVESNSWANLKPEDGLWGGGVKGIKLKPRTEEHKQKIANSVKQKLIESGWIPKEKLPKVKKSRPSGWKWSEQDRAKLSAQRMGRTPWNKGKKAPVNNNSGSES